MPKLLAKTSCLVIGHDHDLLQMLHQRFGAKISIHQATADESLRLLYSSDFRIVVILWNNKAVELAHAIAKINPNIDVILERSRGSLTPSTGQNGFIALLEKNQDRQELLDLVERSILNVPPASEPLSRKPVSSDLNLASLVNRLPQIPLVLDQRERLAHHLLDSVCAALRTHSGGLFLHDKTTASYALVSQRNLGGFLNALRIEDTSPLVESIAGQELIIGGNENVEALVGSFLGQARCNLIVPLILGEDLLGWFLLKVPETLAAENIDLILSIAFFSSECLVSETERSKTTEEIGLLRHILSNLAEAVLWVREDKSMMPVSGEMSLFETRGEIQNAPYAHLTSSKFKAAIQKAFDGEPNSFPWKHKNGSVLNYQGQAEHVPGLGVLLYLRKDATLIRNSTPDAFSLLAVKTLLGNEISQHLAHAEATDPAKSELSKVAVFYLREAQTLLQNSTATVSLLWLAQNLNNLPGLSTEFNDGVKEQSALAGISGSVAAGLLVFFSKVSCPEAEVDLKFSLGGEASSFAIDVHADLPDHPQIFPDDGLQKEFFFSTLSGLGIKLETAAFGLRLSATTVDLPQPAEEATPNAKYIDPSAKKPAVSADYSTLSPMPLPYTHIV